MDIFFDRNVEPRYQRALSAEGWITTDHCDNHFSQTAADSKLAAFAESNGLVLLTRDRPFFAQASSRNCGLLLLDKKRDPTPGDVVLAVERINNAYPDPTNIRESVPGNWV